LGEIVLPPSQPFDLDLTLRCGQAFRWKKIGNWWYGIVEDKPFKVRRNGNRLEFENVSPSFVQKYFGLNDDLSLVLNWIRKDGHMKKVIKALKGLRILRQNGWECLISYICATYKNLTAIERMLFNLSRKFGEKIVFENREFYSFPKPQKLAKASIQELASCGLGYRARYVAETARKIANGDFDIEELQAKPFEEARKALLTLPGVGPKVADCVLLFSLEKLEAFPVDVWMKRVIIKYYASYFEQEFIKRISLKKSLTRAEYEKLSFFGRSYFGKFAGYAQEYLYHFERVSVGKTQLK
jgi:N-glycosylase/DNA lyase